MSLIVTQLLSKYGTVIRLGPAANKIIRVLKLKLKMAEVAILKNKKSQYLCDRCTNFDKIWHGYVPQPSASKSLLF